MTEFTLPMDKDIFAALRRSSDEFVRMLRLAAAIRAITRFVTATFLLLKL